MPRPPADVLARGLRLLGTAVREQPATFAVAAVGSALFAGMTVSTAFVIGAVTGRVVAPAFDSGHVATGTVVGAGMAVLGVVLLKIVGILGRRLGAAVMQFRLMADYRRRVTRQYLTLPLSWHQRHPTGSLLSNANSDVEATWWVIAPFPMAVGTVLMIGIAGVALLLTDWVLAVVGFCVFPAVVTVNVLYSRKVSPRVTRAQQLRAELSAVAHESFDGALVVKTLGKEDIETARFATAANELRDTLISVGRARGTFDPLMEALPNLGTLAVLAVGAIRLGDGAVSVQDVVSVAFLFSIMAFPIRAIGWVLGELPRSVVGWDRLRNVLTATGEMPYGDRVLPATTAPAELTVEKLSFTYAPPATDDGPYEPQPALRDVDFQVRAGRTVAVVGPTGAGKSTLAGLMVRLVDPDSGAVALDGVDLRELAAGELPRHIALVPQTTFLFDDTVRGNVTLGADVEDERVWQALRLAQADRFVRALPDGLDTMVGERGTTLSGGQRQRLALARALVRRPRLLVLDDATSSVDSRVEAAILRGLREAELASTVVVVAYRQATIALADEIVYLEHGAVVARGSHAELLRAAPGYAELVHAYAEAEEERRRERATHAAAAAAGADADADDQDEDEEVVA